MNWLDNPFLEGDSPDLRLRGQLQLALYAIHLSFGHNIYSSRIKAATIEQYVLAAATFLAQANGFDMRKDSPHDSKMGHLLAPVYRELRRFEGIPDRREPYDTKMHAEARLVALDAPPLGVISALTDWFEQGLLTGYRLSEFAQPSKGSNILYPQTHNIPSITPATRALVPSDIRAQLINSRRVRGLDILLHPVNSISKMWIKYRVQKNKQHGEEKAYAPNPKPDGYCFIRSMYRILSRYHLIAQQDSRVDVATTPLGLYWDSHTNVARLLTSTAIESYMRWLAAKAYHLDPETDAEALSKCVCPSPCYGVLLP